MQEKGENVNILTRLASLLMLIPVSVGAVADTYRCSISGKTVISDTPCASKASKVDQSSDQVSRSQKLQAELVNQRNQSQLSELEYKAARDRNVRGGIAILPGEPISQPSSNRRSR
jgi:ribosomal protein L29